MGMGFIHAMNPLTLILMIGATALGITIGCLLRRHLRRFYFRHFDSYARHPCFCGNGH